jgi:hypothetical protein
MWHALEEREMHTEFSLGNVMCFLLVMYSLLGYVFFVSLSILIVMYVPFCVIVLFCVLFV